MLFFVVTLGHPPRVFPPPPASMSTNCSVDNDRICELFIVYDSEKNPLRSLISLVPNDPVLLKAVLALAAQHKANDGQHAYEDPSGRLTDTQHHALTFKHDAIRGLSQAIQDVDLSRQDSTVVSIFLLIFLDLLESGSDHWNVHIEGAKKFIALLNQRTGYNPGQTVQDIRGFITKQIYLYVYNCTFPISPPLTRTESRLWAQRLHARDYFHMLLLPTRSIRISWNSRFSGVRDIYSTPSGTSHNYATPSGG